MNYILISPLEHIAVAKIATTLWNQTEIRNLMGDFLSSVKKIAIPIILTPESKEEWLKVEDNVKKKVHQLPLPELLKEKVLNAVKPVGSLILKWMIYYGNAFSAIDLPKEFCWTSLGILDETETAKVLIKDKSINITRRYRISCIYCLEDNIKELWNELPEDSKKSICSESSLDNANILVIFWTDYINVCQFNADYLLACLYACKNGTRVAAEYFFKKLCPSTRYTVLYAVANEILNCILFDDDFLHKLCYDIMLSLLTLASTEQQIKFIQMSPSAVCLCILDWPWQSFFTKTVSYLRSCHPEDYFGDVFYDTLLRKIISKILQGYKDFRYQNLLEECWPQRSKAFKRVFNEDMIACLLEKLFEMKDRNNIKLILQDASISKKLKIIFSIKGRNICKDMIEDEDWDLLKFFIQECVSSKIKMLKFKAIMKKYMAQLSTKDTFQKNIVKWNNFFVVLEEINNEFCKRKFMENDENRGNKRFAS